MSAIRLVNNVPSSVAPEAELRVFQGEHQLARIGIAAGGSASIPITTRSWTAVAQTNREKFTLLSNTVTFDTPSANLLAQVLEDGGYVDFQLVLKPGTQPSTIVAENTWRNPVQFTLSNPETPLQIATVVDEHNSTTIPTAQEWTAYAIANGITTGTARITDPNATVTLVANDAADGFTLLVS